MFLMVILGHIIQEHGIFLWKFVPLSLAKPHKDWICAHIRVPLSTVKIG